MTWNRNRCLALHRHLQASGQVLGGMGWDDAPEGSRGRASDSGRSWDSSYPTLAPPPSSSEDRFDAENLL